MQSRPFFPFFAAVWGHETDLLKGYTSKPPNQLSVATPRDPEGQPRLCDAPPAGAERESSPAPDKRHRKPVHGIPAWFPFDFWLVIVKKALGLPPTGGLSVPWHPRYGGFRCRRNGRIPFGSGGTDGEAAKNKHLGVDRSWRKHV